MPSSKGARRKGAIKRQAAIARAKRNASGELRGLDAAIAKLRQRAQAGETLSAAQQALLDRNGGTWPQPLD